MDHFLSGAPTREYGLFNLPGSRYDPGDPGAQEVVLDFFVDTDDIDRALDVIELCFKAAPNLHRQNMLMRRRMTPLEGIEELNARFKQHGVGYQFESGEVIRFDSQLVHQEAVKPALHVLSDPRFGAANEEFLKAHEHYRHGNNGEAMNECLKALESTLKVICIANGWPCDERATAKKLIEVAFAHGLVAEHLQSTFGGLRAILENAVPTTRNKVSAHGAGAKPKDIPPYLVGYVLHVTASSILMLAEAEKALV